VRTTEANVDELLRAAIEQKRLIRLRYQNKDRIVEPHDYGVQNGSVKLLAYQIAGSSSGKLPNWRWMEASLISEIHLLNQTFPGRRRIPSGEHHKWGELFIRVEAADSDSLQATGLAVNDVKPTWDSAILAGAIAVLGYPRFRQLRGGLHSVLMISRFVSSKPCLGWQLCQATLSDAERTWLRNSRPDDARYWNLLTDLDSEHLSYGS
jgi:hypothetical protein